jgi:hypothetical protein
MRVLKIVPSISSVFVLFGVAFGQTAPMPTPSPDVTAAHELTGIVSDGVCKGHHNRKAVTPYGCSLKCVGDGADYVLVVGDTVYILEGHKADLDKFAGGRATVPGRVDDNKVIVDSVTAAKRKAKG